MLQAFGLDVCLATLSFSTRFPIVGIQESLPFFESPSQPTLICQWPKLRLAIGLIRVTMNRQLPARSL